MSKVIKNTLKSSCLTNKKLEKSNFHGLRKNQASKDSESSLNEEPPSILNDTLVLTEPYIKNESKTKINTYSRRIKRKVELKEPKLIKKVNEKSIEEARGRTRKRETFAKHRPREKSQKNAPSKIKNKRKKQDKSNIIVSSKKSESKLSLKESHSKKPNNRSVSKFIENKLTKNKNSKVKTVNLLNKKRQKSAKDNISTIKKNNSMNILSNKSLKNNFSLVPNLTFKNNNKYGFDLSYSNFSEFLEFLQKEVFNGSEFLNKLKGVNNKIKFSNKQFFTDYKVKLTHSAIDYELFGGNDYYQDTAENIKKGLEIIIDPEDKEQILAILSRKGAGKSKYCVELCNYIAAKDFKVFRRSSSNILVPIKISFNDKTPIDKYKENFNTYNPLIARLLYEIIVKNNEKCSDTFDNFLTSFNKLNIDIDPKTFLSSFKQLINSYYKGFDTKVLLIVDEIALCNNESTQILDYIFTLSKTNIKLAITGLDVINKPNSTNKKYYFPISQSDSGKNLQWIVLQPLIFNSEEINKINLVIVDKLKRHITDAASLSSGHPRTFFKMLVNCFYDREILYKVEDVFSTYTTSSLLKLGNTYKSNLYSLKNWLKLIDIAFSPNNPVEYKLYEDLFVEDLLIASIKGNDKEAKLMNVKIPIFVFDKIFKDYAYNIKNADSQIKKHLSALSSNLSKLVKVITSNQSYLTFEEFNGYWLASKIAFLQLYNKCILMDNSFEFDLKEFKIVDKLDDVRNPKISIYFNSNIEVIKMNPHQRLSEIKVNEDVLTIIIGNGTTPGFDYAFAYKKRIVFYECKSTTIDKAKSLVNIVGEKMEASLQFYGLFNDSKLKFSIFNKTYDYESLDFIVISNSTKTDDTQTTYRYFPSKEVLNLVSSKNNTKIQCPKVTYINYHDDLINYYGESFTNTYYYFTLNSFQN